MKLIVINKLIHDKIRGSWLRHKGRTFEALEPIEVKNDVYILGFDDIKRIKSKLTNSKYADILKASIKTFTIGDGSLLDQKFQEYLISTKITV